MACARWALIILNAGRLHRLRRVDPVCRVEVSNAGITAGLISPISRRADLDAQVSRIVQQLLAHPAAQPEGAA
jgi:hypothetical protein